MGTDERRRAKRVDGGEHAASPGGQAPPRRWGPALLWLALLAVLVGVAVVVSFAADDRGDPLAEEPFDLPTFCLTAARFGSVSELDMSTSSGLDELRNLRTVALQLATLSPEAVAEDLDDVGDALQRVVDRVQAIPAESPVGAALVAEALDQELGTVSEQAEEAAAYIERWCGPRTTDTTAAIPTTTATEPVMDDPTTASTEAGG